MGRGNRVKCQNYTKVTRVGHRGGGGPDLCHQARDNFSHFLGTVFDKKN